MLLHVFRHEIRLIFREPRFWIPFIIPPVILAASQAIATSRYGTQVFDGMEGYMMLLLGCLMAPMGSLPRSMADICCLVIPALSASACCV